VLITVGSVNPVMLGSGGFVPVGDGTLTSSERQTPSPGMTLLDPLQLAATQDPPRRTWVELEHARQLLGPGPAHEEQLESHVLHDDDVLSKYCDLLHVDRQRPLVRTGRDDEQVEHWLKEGPEQEAQSG